MKNSIKTVLNTPFKNSSVTATLLAGLMMFSAPSVLLAAEVKGDLKTLAPAASQVAVVDAAGAGRLKAKFQSWIDSTEIVPEDVKARPVVDHGADDTSFPRGTESMKAYYSWEGQLKVTAQNGAYEVVLPSLTRYLDDGVEALQVHVGKASLSLSPLNATETLWQTRLAFEPKITLTDNAGTVLLTANFGNQFTSVIYDADLQTFRSGEVQYKNIAFEPSADFANMIEWPFAGAIATISELKTTHNLVINTAKDGVPSYDSETKTTVSGINIGDGTYNIGGVVLDNAFKGSPVPQLKSMLTATLSNTSDAFPEDGTSDSILPAGSFSLDLTNVQVDLDKLENIATVAEGTVEGAETDSSVPVSTGTRIVTVAKNYFSTNWDATNSDSAKATFKVGFEGNNSSTVSPSVGVDVVPSDLDLEVSVGNLPVTSLSELSGTVEGFSIPTDGSPVSVDPQTLQTVFAALTKSGAEISIDNFSVKTSDVSAKLNTAVSLEAESAKGIIGNGKLQFVGLDQFIQKASAALAANPELSAQLGAGGMVALPALQALTTIADADTTEDGKTRHTLNLAINKDGTAFVNKQDISAQIPDVNAALAAITNPPASGETLELPASEGVPETAPASSEATSETKSAE